MATVAKHYEDHLGHFYAWMVGDIDAALSRSTAELAALELPAAAGGIAVDLGAGIGLHSIPLAQAGYAVTAIDSSALLLATLRERAASLPITTVCGDLLEMEQHMNAPADVILCMGDTLTHLPDKAAVETLVAAVERSLKAGGRFVTTFRDYASAPLAGDRRFIPVRSDPQRILTCFLEYAEHTVTVHDLLHEAKDGRWQQRISSYAKLRLAPEWVASTLTTRGLTLGRGIGPNGMTCLVARKI